MTKRDWLIALRNQIGLTQNEVAIRAKIERSTYAQYELGRRNPTVTNAKKIAEILGFDWTIFFANEGRVKTQKKLSLIRKELVPREWVTFKRNTSRTAITTTKPWE